MASAAPVEMGGEPENEPRDYESEARQQGWMPQEEFKGDPARWTDAETFVRRTDEVLPLLKKRDRILKQENDTLKRDLKNVMARFETSEKRAYERAMADLEARQAEAVEMGDVAGVKKATDDIRALERETVAAAPKVSDTEVEEAVIDFRAKNPWYDKDKVVRDYADLLAKRHADEARDMRPSDFFDMIGEKVREKYADRLADNDSGEDEDPKPRRKVLSPVEGGGPRRPRGGKTGADLPPEAMKTADRFVRMGIIKDRDAYAKTFFGAE